MIFEHFLQDKSQLIHIYDLIYGTYPDGHDKKHLFYYGKYRYPDRQLLHSKILKHVLQGEIHVKHCLKYWCG